MDSRFSSQHCSIARTLMVAVSAGLMAFGLWIGWTASDLQFYTPLGPGPGFFPMGIAVALTFSAGASLADVMRGGGPQSSEQVLPLRGPAAEMTVTLVAISFFAFAIERLGFVITVFVMMMVLLKSRGCRTVPTAILVALGGSFGVGFAFTRWLGVSLPAAPFGLLQAFTL